MTWWQFVLFCLACLAAAGCRTNPAVSLLEQENRQLEDRLYELADLMQDCRRENDRLRTRLERFQRGSGQATTPGAPAELLRPDDVAPREKTGFPSFPYEGQSPTIELPDAEMPGEEFLERHRGPAPSDSPKIMPAPSRQDAPTPMPPAEQETPAPGDTALGARAENTQVAVITLNERLTSGYNLDERIGHEGVITVIEPRDAEGRLVDAAAPVTVVVLDPELEGEAQRIARWDFAADQIAALYRKTPLSEGIHLEMVWPEALPVHRRLHLFVRYTTDDGRRLEADRDIEVEVPALEAQRPLPTRTPGSTTASSEPGERWQRSQAPPAEPAAAEPARTASIPRAPDLGPAHSAKQPSAPKRRRPVWSPNRP